MSPTQISPGRKAQMLGHMTFAKFVMSRHAAPWLWSGRETPRGEFIKDMRPLIKLGEFPIIRWQRELDTFLWGRGASPKTVLQGRKMWGEYTRARARKLRQLLARPAAQTKEK